ncbi:Alpha/Beta hydrolase protein [Lyophyllum atratum]|nr:Alpha/Beta hydrolase protein [Lyophyllum atratum]
MSTEKLLTLPDGRTLAYDDGGNPDSSVVVVFLTGILSIGKVTRIPPALQAKGAHYIAPTLPGYGNTSPIPKGKTYATTLAGDMSFLLDHLHPIQPSASDLRLYISGGSFGTAPAQMLYGAPFNVFPHGRHIKGMLLLGAFPPFVNDEERAFSYIRDMSWHTYFGVGPPARIVPFRLLQRLTKSVIQRNLATQESAEAFLRGFLFDKMGAEEKEAYSAWREKNGYEEGQLCREMAENNRRSVEKTWEGFMSTAEVLHSDWGWEKKLGELDEDHTLGRKVLIVGGTEDDGTTIEWGKYLASKYANARIKIVTGGHISVIFSIDEIWAEFMEDSA